MRRSRNRRKQRAAVRQRTSSEDSDRNHEEGSSSSRGSTGSGNGTTTTETTKSVWSWREKNDAVHFLKDYLRGCESIYYSETPTETKEKKIGDAVFPALTANVFRQPFLKLPSTLSSRQRRVIHECCIEVGLYHTSAGPNRKERAIIISAFEDGLDAGLDQQETPYPTPIYKYRPWFCRKRRAEDRIERNQREKIDHLIDQPGECLRDGVDDLDFEKWDDADLSSYKIPPQLEQDESWTLVDTPEKMQMCINELKAARPTEIGFDLECFNRSKYTQLTCLLQLTSDAGRDYVIDTLAPGVWDTVGGLAPFFADPSIVKVGHAIGGLDVRSLHRDFGIFVVNAFDTYEAARVLDMDSYGLASVCNHYSIPDSDVYMALKKQYQNCDWRKRPLTLPMIQYGRYDVHYLLRLRRLLMRDLTRRELWDRTTEEKQEEDERVGAAVTSTLAHFNRFEDDDEYWESGGTSNLDSSFEVVAGMDGAEVGSTEDEDRVSNDDEEVENRNPIARAEILRLQPELMRVISHSQQRCRDLWTKGKESFINHPLRIRYAQQTRRKELIWTTRNEKLLEQLVEWRDRTAQDLECLPGFVAPLDILLPVALQKPTTEHGLRRISLNLPDVLEYERSHREALLEVVRRFIKGEGVDAMQQLVLRHADIGTSRKRKRFPWTVAAAAFAVGAAGVAVAVMASRRRRRL